MSLQVSDPPLILASASLARRAVLEAAGVVFETVPVAIDEVELKASASAEGREAAEIAQLLAETKALRVSRRRPEALVIGADQILLCEGRSFDKPGNLAEAREQLRFLRGRTHVLETAVACARSGEIIWHSRARPRLRMREFSEAWLDSYLAREMPGILNCVGAYRIEGLGIQLFEAVEGEHAAILGIPLLALLRFLRQHGVLLV